MLEGLLQNVTFKKDRNVKPSSIYALTNRHQIS